MTSTTQSQSVQWLLTKGEVLRFISLAKEYGFSISNKIDLRRRPIRASLLKPENEGLYEEFALKMRPHHQSDS